MPSLVDSRLLNNLLKTEKEALKSFRTWTADMASASSALSAWAVADSGDTVDVMDASRRISQLLAACADSQRSYLSSLSLYRTSLKDVLEREAALRTVVRDREILVGRLIKLGNKRPGEGSVEEHRGKVEDAAREMEACETFLQEETAALSSLKRRIFREALSMRMQAMGELGGVMEESAREAIELLSHLGGDELEYSQSITPSHSASQHVANVLQPPPRTRALSVASSSFSDLDRFAHLPTAPLPPPIQHQLYQQPPASLRQRASTPEMRSTVRTPSLLNSSAPASTPRPTLGSIPVAQRGAPASEASLQVPKAPRGVMAQLQDIDSSDEEDNLRAAQHQPLPPQPQQTQRLRRRAQSDTSSITGSQAGGGGRAKRSSFFGGIASLFKRKQPRDSSPERGRESRAAEQWSTRTDRNALTSRVANQTIREEPEQGDSSEDEGARNRSLVRVVNAPMGFRAPKKAASDSGIVVTYTDANTFTISGGDRNTPRLSSTAPTPAPTAARLEKKRGEGLGRGYSSTSHLPSATRSMTLTPAIAAPGAVGTSESIKRKKKKRAESMHDLSSLAAPSISSKRLSHSNTITSMSSLAPSTKKKTQSLSLLPPPPPSLTDLSHSLPSAASSRSIALLRAGGTAGGVPAHLVKSEKAVVIETAKYGMGSWVGKPGEASPVTLVSSGASIKRSASTQQVSRKERAESVMMATVPEEASTSRRYSGGTISALSLPLPLPSDIPVVAAIPRQRDSLSPDAALKLSRRKSVRLADGSTEMAGIPARSPAPSMVDGVETPHKHGILINSATRRENSSAGGSSQGSANGHEHPASIPAVVVRGGESNWTSRAQVAADSSDEDDEENNEYLRARKAFARNTRHLEGAGLVGSERKGKGRAVDF